jgi:hypothetical protein
MSNVDKVLELMLGGMALATAAMETSKRAGATISKARAESRDISDAELQAIATETDALHADTITKLSNLGATTPPSDDGD